tara:strand:+ start:883 stop:1113 length:231 start_codon:yes stop_codon:yes gene_type:complete
MDITIRIDFGTGEAKTITFIGKKEVILPDIQDFIYKNRNKKITVHHNEGEKITYEELFLERARNERNKKEHMEEQT